MRCSKCRADNREGRKFCAQCGSPLAAKCPSCGASNQPGERFCGECGGALSNNGVGMYSPPPPSSASETQTDTGQIVESAPSKGERRHLTVLFCDLVNSTEIAAQLDPEEWRDILARYQRVAAEAVARFEGYIAQYLGDGVLAWFGYPAAHENDAERAVRTGLAIIEGVATVNTSLDVKGLPALAARVGIHAGPVVVGDSDNKSANVFGETPNLAARVQATAERNTLVVSAAVHQLVAGLFVVEDRGAQTLKGIAHPLQLYRAIQPTPARRLVHRAASATQAPFVGRDDEIRLLLSRWERAREGEGQLAFVVGEPGIGKSRLIEEFRARIKDEPHLWIECAGEQFSANTPFHAVIQILDRGLGWRGDESKEERVVQLERSLELAGLKLAEAVPLISEMLNLPILAKYPPLMFAPDQKRRRLLANLAAWLLNAARLQPVVIVLEDLQWVDPSTLELMQTLVEQAATSPLLLLYTARPEFRAPWPMRAHHVQITLNRLSERHTREMIAGVAASTALAKEVIDAVVKRTDGVPLFAEELTRLMLGGDAESAAREIPVTLQDSLAARLDRLGPVKEVAQFGAVLGREFSYEVLHAVSPLSESDLQSALGKLVDAELIYGRGTPPDASYQFKHALIRDAAYEALLKSRRKELHRHVGQVLSKKFAGFADTRPEILARHWTEAGDTERAVAAWKKAGERADARRAFKESEEAYRQALAILAGTPPSAEHQARELELTSALTQVLLMTKGYSASETAALVSRARDLAEKHGNLAQLVLQGYGSWGALLVSGDHVGAMAMADTILGLAQREGTSASLAFAHAAQLLSRFYRGDLVGCEQHLAQWSNYGTEPTFLQYRGAFGHVMGQSAINAWTMGRSDVARERLARALAFARDSNNPYELAEAQYMECWVYERLRDAERSEDAAERTLAVCEEHGFPWFAAFARAQLGLLRARSGAREGFDAINDTVNSTANMNGRLGLTTLILALAEVQALTGATADALTTLENALQVNPVERFNRPEALRVRGELLLKQKDLEAAEVDFRDSLAL